MSYVGGSIIYTTAALAREQGVKDAADYAMSPERTPFNRQGDTCPAVGPVVTWTGSASTFVTAYNGYWTSPTSDVKYCMLAGGVTIETTIAMADGQLVPATLTIEDSSEVASLPEYESTATSFAVVSIAVGGNQVGYTIVVGGVRRGNTHLGGAIMFTTAEQARADGVRDAAERNLGGLGDSYTRRGSDCSDDSGVLAGAIRVPIMMAGLAAAGLGGAMFAMGM